MKVKANVLSTGPNLILLSQRTQEPYGNVWNMFLIKVKVKVKNRCKSKSNCEYVIMLANLILLFRRGQEEQYGCVQHISYYVFAKILPR